ncbi:hypothetical protein V8E51_015917 [Hyaloscypha variabilis]
MFEATTAKAAIATRSNVPDVKVWKADKIITMLSDVVHAMSSAAGSSGRTAIVDAASLRRGLARSWEGIK